MVTTCELRVLLALVVVLRAPTPAHSRGLLLLYRPRDITSDCLHSTKLRYDLSFGMGMSDTITLVMRTVPDVDYECEVDVNTDGAQMVYAVLRMPLPVGRACAANPRAFHVLQKNVCVPVCQLLDDTDHMSRYWMIIKKGRFRFQFRSNSSINMDINAETYEVTVTTARKLDKNESCFTNETECYDYRFDEFYCMTNGIVCDGINNCGVADWYDERKSECEVPIQHLTFQPVVSVLAVVLAVVLAGGWCVRRCLPRGSHFFVFSSNKENRLIVSPVFTTPSHEFEYGNINKRRKSTIPIEWSLSSDSSDSDSDLDEKPNRKSDETTIKFKEGKIVDKPRTNLRIMSTIIGQRLRSVVGLTVPNFDKNDESD